MCFVRISEQKAIIFLHNICVLGFYNQDGGCLQRGTDWILYNLDKETVVKHSF